MHILRPRYPHQTLGTNKAIERPSMGFWMEQRTGKSLSVLDAVGALDGYPALIICPFISIPTWVDEFRKEGWAPEDVMTIRPHGSRTMGDAANLAGCRKPRVFIANIESVIKTDMVNLRSSFCPPSATGRPIERFPRGLGLSDWRSIIIDESYRIAHEGTNITNYLLDSPRPEGQHRFCLSGTPASEQGYNFASQYIWMDGQFFGCHTVGDYMLKYWDYIENTYSWRIKDEYHITEIRNYVQERGYCVTMAELGIGAEIFYSNRLLPKGPEQKKLLDWLSIANTYPHKQTGETMIMEPVVRSTFERQIAAGVHPLTGEIISTTKIKDAVDLYKEDSGPMLVVNRWRPLVEAVSEAMNGAGIKFDYIHGGVSLSKREAIRKAFQAGELDGVSGQVSAIKESLDLSTLDTILYMSNSGGHYDRAQSEKRGNTATRKRPYYVIDQHTDGTNDHLVTNILTVKKRNCSFYLEELNQNIIKKSY